MRTGSARSCAMTNPPTTAETVKAFVCRCEPFIAANAETDHNQQRGENELAVQGPMCGRESVRKDGCLICALHGGLSFPSNLSDPPQDDRAGDTLEREIRRSAALSARSMACVTRGDQDLLPSGITPSHSGGGL